MFGPGPSEAKAPTSFFGPGPSGAKAPTLFFGPGPMAPAPTGAGAIRGQGQSGAMPRAPEDTAENDFVFKFYSILELFEFILKHFQNLLRVSLERSNFTLP